MKKTTACVALLLTFEASAAGGSLTAYGMFMQADWVVKSVMLMLVAASVACWGIFIAKQKQIAAARSRLSELLANSRSKNNLEQLRTPSVLEAQLVTEVLIELDWGAKNNATAEGIKERSLQRMKSRVDEFTDGLTQGTGSLASIGSTAPFIGLFGTVWGIMNSFIGIATTNTTNLAVVAPGIAEALLATAAGLVAAIPAVLMYNHFTRNIALYRKQLNALSSQLLVLAGRQLEQQ
ncbi:tonB-system energizer ExbB [Pseudoalteromonas sp. Of7M-16]|uniref:tonB-system energizer ExbB n=1 Tax=Pseudoalteromonas sp. Of7M-16 TaxID=2917756 RepID=UPI001EF5F7C6|nr:tonB-system energizer ExbB [Pseudoalteromonas sp. Of7M-16]MCG7548769.1 tonB-system energizer ExbB [Pseudoalteromonas sp. Of7M-16]